MQLTDDQKREVSEWIAEGAKLSEVQQKLGEKFGIRLTYMEARLLVDDLKIVPKDPPQPAPAKPTEAPEAASALQPEAAAPTADAETPAALGGVHVRIDQVMRPGALVSGSATFSDGVTAEWYLDQTGRFGLIPPQPGYRPTPEDFAEFRVVLEQELARQGL